MPYKGLFPFLDVCSNSQFMLAINKSSVQNSVEYDALDRMLNINSICSLIDVKAPKFCLAMCYKSVQEGWLKNIPADVLPMVAHDLTCFNMHLFHGLSEWTYLRLVERKNDSTIWNHLQGMPFLDLTQSVYAKEEAMTL